MLSSMLRIPVWPCLLLANTAKRSAALHAAFRPAASFGRSQFLWCTFALPMASSASSEPSPSGAGAAVGDAELASGSVPQTCNGVSLLGAAEATQLDVDLMSPEGGFSIDQLMELAGLSVAEAATEAFPLASGGPEGEGHRSVLLVCGPGNNGGDGLVAARHLWHFGYSPVVVYPKQSKGDLFQGLVKQCRNLGIPVLPSLEDANAHAQAQGAFPFACAVDAIFGFSFKGGPRPPFDSILAQLGSGRLPVLSVDVPSGWDVDRGDLTGTGLQPAALISLTAPKKCAVLYTSGRHFLGGRFVPPGIVEKFGLRLPPYPGTRQVVELGGWAHSCLVGNSCLVTPGSPPLGSKLVHGQGRTMAESKAESKADESKASAAETSYASSNGELAVVWVTAPSDGSEARDLAGAIVAAKLAACVNIVPIVTSVYEWEGKTQFEDEALLMVKTRSALLPKLTQFVQAKHSYEVPETIAASVVGGNRAYLDWVRGNTKQP